MKARDLVLHDPSGEKIVGPVSFSLQAGQCLVVRGPNGSGKTTLLRAIAGQHPHSTGELVHQVPVGDVGFLPQLANVRFHLPLTLRDVLAISCAKISSSELDRHTREIGLLDIATLDRDWNSASGGERQRTLITRLLLGQPKLLVLDEPANHLDAGSKSALLHLLEKFVTERPDERALVLVTHETEVRLSLDVVDVFLAEPTT